MSANVMISQDMLTAIMPQLVLSAGIVLSLLLIVWQRSQRILQTFTIAVLLLAIFADINLLPLFSGGVASTQVTPLLRVDHFSLLSFMLIAISVIAVAVLSHSFLKKSIEVHDEYYLLLQLVALGAGILVVSDHYGSLFLGFELLSIAFIGLVGYLREDKYAIEAGFKYLMLSASASSFMLLGIAFIYSQTGSLSFGLGDGTMNNLSFETTNIFYSVGMLLFLVGIAFKLSLAPFHFWTPDIYQGSPTPIALLLATVSKVAMFTILMKCWFSLPIATINTGSILNEVICYFAMFSMILGNVLALKQQNIKRLLGYSSIAHMGYLLILLVITSSQSIEFSWSSALVYLFGYALANISIFIAISYTGKDELTIDGWRGLFWQNKILASLIIVAVLSFAGIPLSLGFVGKFYLLNHATVNETWPLIGSLIIGSGIGLFYYLRIVFSLFAPVSSGIAPLRVDLMVKATAACFIFITILLGVYPTPLLDLIGS